VKAERCGKGETKFSPGALPRRILSYEKIVKDDILFHPVSFVRKEEKTTANRKGENRAFSPEKPVPCTKSTDK